MKNRYCRHMLNLLDQTTRLRENYGDNSEASHPYHENAKHQIDFISLGSPPLDKLKGSYE